MIQELLEIVPGVKKSENSFKKFEQLIQRVSSPEDVVRKITEAKNTLEYLNKG